MAENLFDFLVDDDVSKNEDTHAQDMTRALPLGVCNENIMATVDILRLLVASDTDFHQSCFRPLRAAVTVGYDDTPGRSFNYL